MEGIPHDPSVITTPGKARMGARNYVEVCRVGVGTFRTKLHNVRRVKAGYDSIAQHTLLDTGTTDPPVMEAATLQPHLALVTVLVILKKCCLRVPAAVARCHMCTSCSPTL